MRHARRRRWNGVVSFTLVTATLGVADHAVGQDQDDFTNVFRVDDEASPGGDGESWLTAFDNLQSAIEAARNAPGSDLIMVAEGVYVPEEPTTGDPRSVTFLIEAEAGVFDGLLNPVWFAGGYRGCPGGTCGPSDPNDRDVETFETFLVGALDGGPGCGVGHCFFENMVPGCTLGGCCAVVCGIDPFCCDELRGGVWDQSCADVARDLCPADAYHVVTIRDTNLTDGVMITRTTRLDGFTITAGSATGALKTEQRGAGLLIVATSPIVAQCKFTGVVIDIDVPEDMDIFSISGNKALNGGGAIAIMAAGPDGTEARPLVVNCSFIQNLAVQGGGGAVHIGLPGRAAMIAAEFINCGFTDNVAEVGSGSAIRGADTSTGVTIVNCTFRRNEVESQPQGGAVIRAASRVLNSVVWENTPNVQQDQIEFTGEVSFSDVQNGWDGDGTDNIEADPDFLGGGITLSHVTSPCLNVGSNDELTDDVADLDEDDDLLEPTSLDLGRGRRVSRNDLHPCDPGRVDMGAFENGDCDGDSVRDEFEIDVNSDRVPDDCQDCNGNMILDPQDIEDGTSTDINGNGIPDECDIDGGCSSDRNDNGIPDEGECSPEFVDIVFIVDTSPDSMTMMELADVCAMAKQIIADLEALPGCLDVEATYLGITETPVCASFPGTVSDVETWLGTSEHGDIFCGTDLDEESWAPATKMIAELHPWRVGSTALRIIVPISDEGPCSGDPCFESGNDLFSTQTAVTAANNDNVFVFPVTGEDLNPLFETCVRNLADLLGTQSDGQAFHRDDEADYAAVGVLLRDAIAQLASGCTFEPCPFDLSGDCLVCTADLLMLLGQWASPCENCPSCTADFDGDGSVSTIDLLNLLANWSSGECGGGGGAGAGGGSDELPLQDALNLLGFGDLSHFHLWLRSVRESEAFDALHDLAAMMMGGH